LEIFFVDVPVFRIRIDDLFQLSEKDWIIDDRLERFVDE